MGAVGLGRGEWTCKPGNLRQEGRIVGILVMKFGGTSVGHAAAIRQAAGIVARYRREWPKLVVVVSAMSGVTDGLLEAARRAAAGHADTYRKVHHDLQQRHRQVIEALLPPGERRRRLQGEVDALLQQFATLCQSIFVLAEVTPRAMDTVAPLGERMSASILAAVLQEQGLASQALDAAELIVTDDQFQNAVPLMELSCARVNQHLGPLLGAGVVPVVTGFTGATRQGVRTTLGRGGSDYTAAILAECLQAQEVWIWTDVDGVMTANPRLIPEARLLPALSYSEVSELAYFGAKVLHPKTIRPIIERGIALWVKNTFNPDAPGTRILRQPQSNDGKVKAVTAITGMSMVTVEGRGMLGVPGIAARTFAAVASQGASVLMISQASSEQSISFIIPSTMVPAVVAAVEQEMAPELARRDIDRIWSLDGVVILTVVGAGLRSTPGVSARIFGALGKKSINVIAIAQGSSECSLSLVVSAADATEAMRQIHQEVILHG